MEKCQSKSKQHQALAPESQKPCGAAYSEKMLKCIRGIRTLRTLHLNTDEASLIISSYDLVLQTDALLNTGKKRHSDVMFYTQ